MSYSLNINNGKTVIKTITIASGTTTAEIDLKGGTLVAVKLPSGLSSTTLKIQEAPFAGGTYTNIIDGLGSYGTQGADIQFTIAASKTVIIPPTISCGLRYIKLLFGSSETAATITYIVRNLD